MKTIAFFNNKGGVGKTSLIYHLAWMFAERGIAVLAADLDPQSNLSAMFLDEDRLAELWGDAGGTKGIRGGQTIYDSLQPLMNRTGDILSPHVERVSEGVGLLSGHLALSRFEDLLSENWPKCLDGQEAAFRVITAFHRILMDAATQVAAQVVLIDVGPNLGAINRSALIAAEEVVLPLAPDLFSLQGLKNLGPTLREWRKGWEKRLEELSPSTGISAPAGTMHPVGYVVMQHGIRGSRPVKAYQRWLERIPAVYREAILGMPVQDWQPPANDPDQLALLKHYRSLMPLAMDARKPMFYLRPADGAIGSHVEAVRACYEDFQALSMRIL
ncbi:MAG: ParA family protein [Magnetococcales bacterium]|nr:ParA family protein [Magnetococcales bacterium]